MRQTLTPPRQQHSTINLRGSPHCTANKCCDYTNPTSINLLQPDGGSFRGRRRPPFGFVGDLRINFVAHAAISFSLPLVTPWRDLSLPSRVPFHHHRHCRQSRRSHRHHPGLIRKHLLLLHWTALRRHRGSHRQSPRSPESARCQATKRSAPCDRASRC